MDAKFAILVKPESLWTSKWASPPTEADIVAMKKATALR